MPRTFRLFIGIFYLYWAIFDKNLVCLLISKLLACSLILKCYFSQRRRKNNKLRDTIVSQC